MTQRTSLIAVLMLLMLVSTMDARQKEKKPKKQKKANDPIVQQLQSGDATQVQAAVRQIREMLESEPSAAIAQLRKNKGWMVDLLAAGQYEDAAELAQQAILLRPGEMPLIDPASAASRGNKKQKKANDPIAQQLTSGDATQIQAAVRLLEAMLASPEAKDRTDAERAELHYVIGCALNQAGRYAQAMAHFQAAVGAEDYNPQSAVWAFVRGSLELGEVRKAQEYYRIHLLSHGPLPENQAKYLVSLIEKAKMEQGKEVK